MKTKPHAKSITIRKNGDGTMSKQKKDLHESTANRSDAYQLKITLSYTNPPIWRRLLVHSDINLGLLHAVFQVAMGWTNSHLHHFIIGKDRYADPRMNEERFMDEEPDLDEWKTSLATALSGKQSPFLYEYDFGDSWQHLIEVEKIHGFNELFGTFAKCLEGSRACPPEDCGGVSGYEDLLKIIQDPKHEEHESMIGWVGDSFDPDAFDLVRINTFLRKLKRPRMTDEQLARVLMERDGYKG